MDGFRRELTARAESIKAVRVELEGLYSKRIDDAVVDLPENSSYKEDCMKALRNAEATFNSYAGSVRSIKSVVETCIIKIKSLLVDFTNQETTELSLYMSPFLEFDL